MTATQLNMWAAPKAEAATAKDYLRWYQREDFNAVQRKFESHRRVMGVGFCAYGKTTLGAELVRHEKTRVLWIAGRDVLLSQARERIETMTGEPCGVEKAGLSGGGERVIVGSIQTLRGARLKSWAADWFQLIIVDECHHAVSKSYRAILDHFSGARVFGITATPRRHDKAGMHNVFEAEAFKRDAMWGMDQGYLVQPIPIAEFVDSVHLEGIKIEKGDLKLSELEDEIAKNAAKIVGSCWKHVSTHATLWFTPGVASAHGVAATINQPQYAPGTAVAVDASTDDVTRRSILRDFAAGKLRHVVNCGIYGEGADFPHATAVVDGKPTKSEADYMQRNLRPGRPLPGIGELATREERLAAIAASSKPRYVLVNVTGNAGQHTLANVVDSLAGEYLKPQKERAKKLLAADPGKSLADVLKLAGEELAEEDRLRREAIARAAAAAIVKSRTRAFDPFKRLGVTTGPLETGQEPAWTAEPPTQDDLAWLKKNNLATKGATKGTVARLRKQGREWYAAGMANYRQRNMLSRYGCPVDVPFTKANELMTLCYSRGNGKWPGKPTQQQIEAVMTRDHRPEPGWDG